MAFDDIEVVNFLAEIRIDASDVTDDNTISGDTEDFEDGDPVVDYDEVVDRNEELRLLEAQHRMVAFVNGGEDATPSTQYGVVAVAAEVSASPARSDIARTGTQPGGTTFSGNAIGRFFTDDTIDIIGRPLAAKTGQDFSDTTNGAGGAAGGADDAYVTTMFPGEYGRFHPRDELFVNGQIRMWNMDVAGVGVDVRGQHVYGVLEG